MPEIASPMLFKVYVNNLEASKIFVELCMLEITLALLYQVILSLPLSPIDHSP